MTPIPVDAARQIAEAYGYDQVIVYARRVGAAPDPHGEHMTTYGVDEVHCGVAARIGAKLQEMIWSVTPAAEVGSPGPSSIEDGGLSSLDPSHEGDGDV